jgi:hypothetical protein
MRKAKACLLYLIVIVVIASCGKDNGNDHLPANATEILTASPWKLISYGYDSNNNELVDIDEDAIRDCDKDNIYTFNINGSGVITENERICSGGEPISQFNWRLTNDDTAMDFYFGKAFIVKLTMDTLIISNSDSDPVKLLLIYVR